MANRMRYVGQALFYGAIITFIGYFSTTPAYTHIPPEQAVIKLSIKHAGEIKGDCRKRSSEELSQMNKNMRVAQECPRERSPLVIELTLDGEQVHSGVQPPRGLRKDGIAAMYHRFIVPSGEHEIRVRMSDDVHFQGFKYERTGHITLKPSQVFVIDFDTAKKVFTFR